MSISSMTIPFTYTETETPPRCRKPRPVKHEDTVTVVIREIDEQQAPVAIVERDLVHECAVSFRWYGGQLWSRESSWNRGRTDRMYSSPDAWDYSSGPYRDYMSRAERIEDILEWTDSWLIIGGKPYRPVGEPRYVVMTFGLGHNHGGTAVMVDHGYNSNIGKQRYFPITQREAAIAEATRIAKARGDTNDLPIRPHGTFRVLIPEVVRLNPAGEHGDGDPFINSIERLTETAGHPTVAALGVLALLSKTLFQQEMDADGYFRRFVEADADKED